MGLTAPFRRLLRFGLRGGLRSIEIDREAFRRQLSQKHGINVTDFRHLRYLPVDRLDAVAKILIRDAGRLALLEGAGFGLGGMITIIPDAGLLTFITLRLIQRLCLLYGFDFRDDEQKRELWLAAAVAAGVDFGKDFAEKQFAEKLAPIIAERLAVRIGAEAAEKWVARLVPLAGSAICGGLNFAFVRGWGRRVQRNLHAQFIGATPLPVPRPMPYVVPALPAPVS